jgi:hypothetical protein
MNITETYVLVFNNLNRFKTISDMAVEGIH